MVLTIAGSDSGGGAGLQADLRTFAAHGVHGATAVTAVTAQNTVAVTRSLPLAADLVVAQVDAVCADLPPVATKTGMLATPAIVDAVAILAAAGRLPNLVVDPVLVSSTGHPLMDDGGVDAYRRHLVPQAAVLTPNLREAAVLTGRPLHDLAGIDAMVVAARELQAMGAATVVIKGGDLDRALLDAGRASSEDHDPDGPGRGIGSPDVVAGPSDVRVLEGTRVATGNDHGTGCSLSAAIAAGLALGADPLDAVVAAKAFVRRALEGGARWTIGAGHGPIDHLGWSVGRTLGDS